MMNRSYLAGHPTPRAISRSHARPFSHRAPVILSEHREPKDLPVLDMDFTREMSRLRPEKLASARQDMAAGVKRAAIIAAMTNRSLLAGNPTPCAISRSDARPFSHRAPVILSEHREPKDLLFLRIRAINRRCLDCGLKNWPPLPVTDLSDPSPSPFQSVVGQAPMPQTHDIWKGSALQSPSYMIDICQLLNSVARFWTELVATSDRFV